MLGPGESKGLRIFQKCYILYLTWAIRREQITLLFSMFSCDPRDLWKFGNPEKKDVYAISTLPKILGL